MKKVLNFVTTVILLLSIIGALPVMAIPETPLQTKSTFNRMESFTKSSDYIYLFLNKKSITLQKGKTITLKVTTDPVNANVKITWKSSNTKIAKVSSNGLVTAVAAGTAVISVTANNYGVYGEDTGLSNECFVTVQGNSKEPKPLGTNDQTFYYNKTKLKVPEWSKNVDFSKTLSDIKKSIGGTSYTESAGLEGYHYAGIILGSKNVSQAHTDIYYQYESMKGNQFGFGFVASGKSPIKLYRGIVIGSKKSLVQSQYGLPTDTDIYNENGKTYEWYGYRTYSLKSGKAMYMTLTFSFLKSKNTVENISYYYGRLIN